MTTDDYRTKELVRKVHNSMNESPRPLDVLERTIANRAAMPNDKSYTCKLLAGGNDAIGVKIIEEAAELVEAAAETDADARVHFIHEASDLVYHLLVFLQHKNVTLADVEAELARRFGVSGLNEKARRTAGEYDCGTSGR